MAPRILKGIGQIPALLRNPRKRWRVILPLILILGIAGGAAYYYEQVYLPAQAASQPTLQTTVARRGSIVLSTTGTGTLISANQIDLGFKTNGTLTAVNVKVGDKVQDGQVLAQLDDSSEQIQLTQAKQTLAGLTSAAAIASAQESIATATKSLQSAKTTLAYQISPPVYYWENEIAKDQQAVKDAQAAVDAAPTDQTAEAALQEAQNMLEHAQLALKGAQYSYEKTYLPNNFTYFVATNKSGHKEKYYNPPSDADILAARSAVTVAEGALLDAQNLYAALTGGTVPADASGSNLQSLTQAQLAVQNAQNSLQDTQLIAPFSGTVTAVNDVVGDTVGTNSTVISLADFSKLFQQTYVDESDYGLFKVGNSATIVFDALPDQTFTGKVTEVDPALATSSGSSVVSGLVEMDPTDAHLLLGMSASVTVISAQAQNVVLVPLSALHEYSAGQYAVFVERNGKLSVQFVEIGLEDLVNVEIKSGLQPGEVVSTGLLASQ